MKTNIKEVKKNLAEFSEIWQIEINQQDYTLKNRLNALAIWLHNAKVSDDFLLEQLSPEEKQYFEFAVILANAIL